MKKCCDCKVTKEFMFFGKNKAVIKDGHQDVCRVCMNKRMKDYRATGEYKKIQDTPAWRLGLKIRMKRWAKSRPWIPAANCRKQQAGQNAPKWLSDLQLNQIKRFYEAAHKLKNILGVKCEVDHIVPLNGEIVSGLHVPWNLQVVTMKQNRSKGKKLIGVENEC